MPRLMARMSTATHSSPVVNHRDGETRLAQQWMKKNAAPRASRLAPRASAARSDTEPSVQLATAKLPPAINLATFYDVLYQWASTLTQSGGNLPFILPLKADKIPSGFQISLLKRIPDVGFDSAGDIVATVEDVPGQGNILFIRFYEGPASSTDRRVPPSADVGERLDATIKALPDVDVIVQTMPAAIRKAVLAAKA